MNLRELPENEILDIGFIETSIGDVMFRLKEKYGERSEFVEAKRPARNMKNELLQAITTHRSGEGAERIGVYFAVHPILISSAHDIDFSVL